MLFALVMVKYNGNCYIQRHNNKMLLRGKNNSYCYYLAVNYQIIYTIIIIIFFLSVTRYI